jgi:hypothetical protein
MNNTSGKLVEPSAPSGTNKLYFRTLPLAGSVKEAWVNFAIAAVASALRVAEEAAPGPPLPAAADDDVAADGVVEELVETPQAASPARAPTPSVEARRVLREYMAIPL